MEIPHLDKQIYNKLDKELGAAIDMNDDSLLPLPNRDDLMAQLLEEEANKEQINSTIRKKKSVPNIPIIKETEDIEIKLDENPPKTDEVKAKRIDVEKVLAKKNLDEIWVQLGTFKAEDEATKAWQEVRESNADIFGDVGIRVTKSESDKGIYYRLQSGPIYNEDDARDLCKKLNARQQSCFYVNTKGSN
jgi:cell division septation protein DedD